MRHALAGPEGGSAESERSPRRSSPFNNLADNRPSPLGEHSERNAKPTFILSAMGDRIFYGCPLGTWPRGILAREGLQSDSLAMTVTCANPRILSHFLAQLHIRRFE